MASLFCIGTLANYFVEKKTLPDINVNKNIILMYNSSSGKPRMKNHAIKSCYQTLFLDKMNKLIFYNFIVDILNPLC